jgi:ankyrin repeat protein
VQRVSRARTPLHLAAYCGHHAVVKELLAANAPVDAVAEAGVSALHVAVCKGHPAAAVELLAGGADARALAGRGRCPLELAVCGGREHATQLLIHAGADANATNQEDGVSMVSLAVAYGHMPVVLALQAAASHTAAVREAWGMTHCMQQ